MKHLSGSIPRPSNFYKIGQVQVRVFNAYITMWVAAENYWIKRFVQMAPVQDPPMLDTYEIVHNDGKLGPPIESKHVPERIRNLMDEALPKARAVWILHKKG